LLHFKNYLELAQSARTMLVTASLVDAIREREYCTKFVGFLLYCLFVRPNTPISSQRIVLVLTYNCT
jgi:hypothetical protein